jgi:hypothetical protein
MTSSLPPIPNTTARKDSASAQGLDRPACPGQVPAWTAGGAAAGEKGAVPQSLAGCVGSDDLVQSRHEFSNSCRRAIARRTPRAQAGKQLP